MPNNINTLIQIPFPSRLCLVYGATMELYQPYLVSLYFPQRGVTKDDAHNRSDLVFGCNALFDMNAELTWACHLFGRPDTLVTCNHTNLGRTSNCQLCMKFPLRVWHSILKCQRQSYFGGLTTLFFGCILFVSQLLLVTIVVCVSTSLLSCSYGLTRVNTRGIILTQRSCGVRWRWNDLACQMFQFTIVVCVSRSLLSCSCGLTRLNTTGFFLTPRTCGVHWRWNDPAFGMFQVMIVVRVGRWLLSQSCGLTRVNTRHAWLCKLLRWLHKSLSF